MGASEPKCVNSILDIIVANLLRLKNLQLYDMNIFSVENKKLIEFFCRYLFFVQPN